jgi:hypothetical protein
MHRKDSQPSSTALRWQRWQRSTVAQRYLTPEALIQGYTLLKCPPQSREAFFIMVDVILARGHFEHQLPRLLEHPDTLPALQDAQAAWNTWRTWTRRLAAYLERVASGREGTRPPVPEALHGLLDALGEGEHADTPAR